MYEQRLTSIHRRLRDLRWALSQNRTVVLTLGQRACSAAMWCVLGALVMASAVAWYAIRYPGEVLATDARLDQQSPQYLIYSIGLEHRGVAARCRLVIYRDREKFTVSC